MASQNRQIKQQKRKENWTSSVQEVDPCEDYK